ncbi:uncharacterized protein RCC_00113 [Ramularia collo-cygni]|uniref:Heterokaryon incompatibility domain-containing protein n=1 Tax=Ramularia collo-cygni TaxID=112498 RepID=A0A2D3UQ21_9PEZI|nr:uncharacterized protein RCC_00113 [Ramularia collo-cygni]CZT14140.1 uncharacterized protein RCC_00113 [Ramularia collo-cygni]
MRLLHTHTLQFSEHVSPYEAPGYIIASHRWLDDEVSYQEFVKNRTNTDPTKQRKAGMDKVLRFCEYINQWRSQPPGTNIPHYIWIDTICINKDSSAELQEAITSMFEWYAQAWCCLVWMHDVSVDAAPLDVLKSFCVSVWFTRGWTLQELLAPKTVIFLDEQWRHLGHKSSTVGLMEPDSQAPIPFGRLGWPLNKWISKATGIDKRILWDYRNAGNTSIEERQSWMNKRQTTRREDRAYCMLGICEIFMPLNYGEGSNADKRLERKILKKGAQAHRQPLSPIETSQQLPATVFRWQPPNVTKNNSAPQIASEITMSLEGPQVLMLLDFWLSQPGQTEFQASNWAKNLQQFEDLKKYIQQDRMRRFELKIPRSGEIAGSYITKREPNGAMLPIPGTAEWEKMIFQALANFFQGSDESTIGEPGQERRIAAEQLVPTPDQLELLKHVVAGDPAKRYSLRVENPLEGEGELSKLFIYLRCSEPDPTRLKLISDLLFSVIESVDRMGSVDMASILNQRDFQRNNITFAELIHCLRNSSVYLYNVRPRLPQHGDDSPGQFHIGFQTRRSYDLDDTPRLHDDGVKTAKSDPSTWEFWGGEQKSKSSKNKK